MLGRLGDDDFARTFRSLMAAEGIDQSHVLTDPTIGTGVGMPLVEPDGQNSIVIIPRSNRAIAPSDICAAAALIGEACVLLLQLELPVDTALEAARAARSAGTRVILNPAPYHSIPPDLIEMVDVIVPNENEFEAWREAPTSDLESLLHRASESAENTFTDIIVTVGARGVVVAPQGGEPIHLPPHTVTAIDTVGAGDVFCGNVAASLARGDGLTEAAQVGNAAAALAITRRGGATTAPTLAETRQLIHAGVPQYAAG
jgi:ribokinase